MEKTCNEANKIFILSPAGIVTGGVELLHQLCNVLGGTKFSPKSTNIRMV